MFLHKSKSPKSTKLIKTQISTPIIQDTIQAPKKVIKALYDYQAQDLNELSFSRGDFFLVLNTQDQFYEAFNPITNQKGYVPSNCFQLLDKHEKSDIVYQEIAPQKPQPLYGVVLYDFQAERSDELDAKAGEAIIIIAQSNSEWYVAKPIGRLGGPGLIPVSFVDIRDATTGQVVQPQVLQIKTDLFPKVEEWKKKTQGYEASSITLGKIEKQPPQMVSPTTDTVKHDDYYLDESDPIVLSAYIDTHILEGDQYWFIVFAKLSNGKFRVLYRLYEDFYDFQLLFLNEFPLEAGKQNQQRTLPYMPGPVEVVTDDITADRARDLSTYCYELLNLPPYLSQCPLVQYRLFGIHEGDIETDIDPSQTNETIKVKIIYKDEIFAIKVPITSSIDFLKDKIVQRLGFDVQLRYKSGDRLSELNPMTFEQAVKLGKLTVVAS